jgi:hypothetical protein
MTALIHAIAEDLGVEPRDLIAESLRALALAPFLFAGFLAFLLLLSMLATGIPAA